MIKVMKKYEKYLVWLVPIAIALLYLLFQGSESALKFIYVVVALFAFAFVALLPARVLMTVFRKKMQALPNWKSERLTQAIGLTSFLSASAAFGHFLTNSGLERNQIIFGVFVIAVAWAWALIWPENKD